MTKRAEQNPFNIAHHQFGRLKDRAIESGVPADNIRLVKVVEVPNLAPYTTPGKQVDTISDLDNVWVGWGNRSLVEKTNISQALTAVIRSSTRFSLWSSRICAADTNSHLARRIESLLHRWTGRMGAFPFLPQSDKDWLTSQAAQINPSCQLDYELGFGKLASQHHETFNFRVAQSLKNGAVVMIGSSAFDRRRADKVLETVSQTTPTNFYYFDTGAIIL